MGFLEAPHDTFFRAVLGHPAGAASWLCTVLPARVVGAIDWGTLLPAPDTALGVRLRRHHADLVFTARLRATRGALLLLIEHKAQHDPDLSSQVLRYAVHLRRAAGRRTAGPEPLVLAVVLHHGPVPLRDAPPHPHLADMPAAEAEALAALQPRLSFVVDDIAGTDERALHRPGLLPSAWLALLCLRFLRDFTGDDLLAAFERWADLLRAVDRLEGEDTVDAVCWYAVAVTEVAPEALTDVVSRILQRPEDTIMSTLERTYQKGKAEGKAEGRAETILRMLHQRFGELPPEVTARVRTGSPTDLDRWTDRILDSKTLAALFATD